MLKRHEEGSGVIKGKITALAIAIILALGVQTAYCGTMYCGRDVNGDGKLTEGEAMQCIIGADESLLCPVDAVDCIAAQEAAQCPASTTLNTVINKCEASPLCPSGYSYNGSRNICEKAPSCASGSTYNAATDRCEKAAGAGEYACPLSGPSCAQGWQYSCVEECADRCWWDFSRDQNVCGVQCKQYDYNLGEVHAECTQPIACDGGFTLSGNICYQSATCPSGTMNVTTGLCEAPATEECPSGYAYNTVYEVCHKTASCPSGSTFLSSSDICYLSYSPTCTSPLVYNASRARCEAPPVCINGTYNTTRNRCEMSPVISCLSGYTFNSTHFVCNKAVACPSGSTFLPSSDICYLSYSPTCTSPFVYNSSRGRCEVSPTCSSGTYNTTRNRCELSPAVSCPSGYTYNSSYGVCLKALSCPSGSTFAPASEVCYRAYTPACTSPLVYNASRNRCEIPPVCSSGTYNATRNRCEASRVPTCPPGHTYDSSRNLCTIAPTCVSGTTFNPSTHRCEKPASQGEGVYTCPYGSPQPGWVHDCVYGCTYDYQCGVACSFGGEAGLVWCSYSVSYYCTPEFALSGSICYQAASCPYGVVNGTLNLCLADATLSCPSGFTYDSGNNVCYKSATCSRGSLDGTYDVCWTEIAKTCPSGFTYNSGTNRCELAASTQCASGDTYSTALDGCTRAPTISCSSGFTYDSGNNICYLAATCSSGALDSTYDVCWETITKTCPSGFTYNSSTNRCELAASTQCASGDTYSAPLDGCTRASTPVCSSGFTYDSTNNICYLASTCPSGSLDGTYDVCWTAIAKTCPSGFAYNSGTNRCELAASTQCASGDTYSAVLDGCTKPPTISCSSGFTYDSTSGFCHRDSTCPRGALDSTYDVCWETITKTCPSGFTYNSGTNRCELAASALCASGDTYSAALDGCTRTPEWECPVGTLYIQSIRTCQSDPACAAGAYNPDTDKCHNASDLSLCPIDPAKVCVDNNGLKQCSPNPCFDPKTSGPYQEMIVQNDSTMLMDDGARDADGRCLDEIYIFTGRSMTCRTSGIDSGWQNCCMTSESPLKDSIGSAITAVGAVSTILDVYHMGQIAYYGTQYLEMGYIVGDVANLNVSTALNAVWDAQSLMAGFESYTLTTLLNPTTLALSAAVYLAKEILLSGSCTQEDFETAMMDNSGRCHFINSYCEKKWPLIGCVQEVNVFCCFNSKLARIVHEQGRPQLKTFTPLWGYDEGPGNCRGFKASEFQMLDFSKMNLSEYFGEITTKAQGTIRDEVGTKINEYYNKTQK